MKSVLDFPKKNRKEEILVSKKKVTLIEKDNAGVKHTADVHMEVENGIKHLRLFWRLFLSP